MVSQPALMSRRCSSMTSPHLKPHQAEIKTSARRLSGTAHDAAATVETVRMTGSRFVGGFITSWI